MLANTLGDGGCVNWCHRLGHTTHPIEETKMFKNRFLVVIGVISLLLVTMAVSTPRSNASSSPAQSGSDFYQRHPDWTWTVRNGNAVGPSASSDYFQRHPELTVPSVLGLGASDYFQRHTELTAPSILGLGASDYFQRHPELSAPVERSVDTTDYFFRHLDDNTSDLVISFNVEQIRREYFLGERYGVTPQGYAEQQILREYWLGERYGQTP